MKALLLGNGFDLYHLLPTKYENFLHTVDFLKNNYDKSMDTIGKVFGNTALQSRDAFIAKSYERYKQGYDEVKLDSANIADLIEMAKHNMWFSYLLKSFNQDLGWIDFEREIARVLKEFSAFFGEHKNCDSVFISSAPEFNMQRYIIQAFDFFCDKEHDPVSAVGTFCRPVKKDYIIENPYGSKNFELDKEKIIKEMQDHLLELAKMLKIYLSCFVESAIDLLEEKLLFRRINGISGSDHVFTLNYTTTFEKIYESRNSQHIHGSLCGNIVLGVNADTFDELENLNTDFISFKKYYQRILFQTDAKYQETISHIKKYIKNYDIELYIIGHSLDVTDKDIIIELFEVANKITILYHDEKVIGSYIKNLVAIYGKQHFDDLRIQKNLKFKSLQVRNPL